MFDTVTVTYNIQSFENGKWNLIFRTDFSDVYEIKRLLEDCYKFDPNGIYQIVEHWR
jgi:hypothetical protein